MKKTQFNRISPALLAASAVMGGLQVSAAPAISDTLFVNWAQFNETKTLAEVTPEGSIDFGPFVTDPGTINERPKPLPKTGYIVIYEPNGTDLSDILVCFTGSSLQYYSDGSTFFPKIADLKAAGLVELANFKEDAKTGIDKEVGDLFGIDKNRIRLTSDGDATPVPEPSTYITGLSALGMLGLFGWRNRK